MYVLYLLHAYCGKWEGCARKPVNHTIWVADVTPTDRPKSVRNRSVIDHFCDVFVYFHIWWHPAFMEVFLILLGQISFLF